MNAARVLKSLLALAAVLILALLIRLGPGRTQPPPPPPDVQGQSFSVASENPLTGSGVHPADILGTGGQLLIACEDLGLLCTDLATGAQDDLQALSYGYDFLPSGLPAIQFSVDVGSQGLSGTAVRVEAGCVPPEPQADVFEMLSNQSNLQDLDGDGTACGGNAGYGLLINEAATSDNVDALERNPCLYVDADCNGLPEEPLFFSLAPGSPTLAMIGATPADVLMANAEYAPVVWANGIADWSLQSGDVIDALCLKENGNGVYDSGDQVLFSLAAGSPSLSLPGLSAADLLRPGPGRYGVRAALLGLQAADDVDAIACSGDYDFYDLFLPVVHKP